MAKLSKFALPKNELFYYDENDNTYKPIAKADGMLPVQSVQKKWKDAFTKTTLNSEKWEVVQTGQGQTIDNAIIGECRINTGVTANSETIILSKETFSIPMRGLFGFQLSQKIVNQEFYLEFVSVDKATGIPDGLNKVSWKISGTDSLTTSNARVLSQTGGITPIESAVLGAGVAQTGAPALYELELFADEAWYHTRVMDSANGRSYSFVKHNNIPDPNGQYKMQIRVKNGSTAPASNTYLQLFFVNVVDYAELTAEITSGRGSASAGQGISTTIAGGAIGTVSTAYTAPKMAFTTETVANIATATPFTTTVKDVGATPLYSAYRLRVFSDQPIKVEILAGTSTTFTSNRVQQTVNVPANTMTVIDMPIVARYFGVRFTNTGTATTTVMEALSALIGT